MSWAIVIGIDDYGRQQPTLQAAVYDAEQFASWLVDRAGLPKKQVKTLLGRRPKDRARDGSEVVPTKDNVLRTISEVMSESGGTGENLFFYLRGHGMTATYANREESALVFPGIDDAPPDPDTRRPIDAEFFETTRFKDQFFFIDACRSRCREQRAEIGAWPIPRRREPGKPPAQQFVLYATSPGRTRRTRPGPGSTARSRGDDGGPQGTWPG